jgi:hypothetical protein
MDWIGTAMAKPSTVRLQIQVEHVRIEVAKPFEAVKSALEALVPPPDPAIPEALRQGDIVRANEALQRGPELAIFSARDHGRHGRPLAQGRAVRDRQSAYRH